MPYMPATYTTQEAALKLNVSERTVRNMIRRGSLEAIKLDPTVKSVYRIPVEAVDKLLQDREATRINPSK